MPCLPHLADRSSSSKAHVLLDAAGTLLSIVFHFRV